MSDIMLPNETVMLDKFASDLNLELLYAGRGIIRLTSISVDRPGLRLAGFFSYFDTQRIMIIGLTEHEYLHSFSGDQRREKIRKLFDCGEIPCIIFSRDLPVKGAPPPAPPRGSSSRAPRAYCRAGFPGSSSSGR